MHIYEKLPTATFLLPVFSDDLDSAALSWNFHRFFLFILIQRNYKYLQCCAFSLINVYSYSTVGYKADDSFQIIFLFTFSRKFQQVMDIRYH